MRWRRTSVPLRSVVFSMDVSYSHVLQSSRNRCAAFASMGVGGSSRTVFVMCPSVSQALVASASGWRIRSNCGSRERRYGIYWATLSCTRPELLLSVLCGYRKSLMGLDWEFPLRQCSGVFYCPRFFTISHCGHRNARVFKGKEQIFANGTEFPPLGIASGAWSK